MLAQAATTAKILIVDTCIKGCQRAENTPESADKYQYQEAGSTATSVCMHDCGNSLGMYPGEWLKEILAKHRRN